LRGEEFVVGEGDATGERGFAGEEQLGLEQPLFHLDEHEAVELVGSDEAFTAASLGSAGLDGVVVGPAVVAGSFALVGRRGAFIVAEETETTRPAA
jgi:hypothetical protein